MVPDDLQHFKASEFKHPELMDVAFLRWLDRVRERADVPFSITSDGRTASDSPDGASLTSLHHRGRAVDLDSSRWNATQKWRIVAAIVYLSGEAPGKVEFEPVFSPTDKHWHIAVDDRAGKSHEFVEADD